MNWLSATVGSEEPKRVLDLLEILAQHPTAAVKEKECEIAKRKYHTSLVSCRQCLPAYYSRGTGRFLTSDRYLASRGPGGAEFRVRGIGLLMLREIR
jgi:hypothetical protein